MNFLVHNAPKAKRDRGRTGKKSTRQQYPILPVRPWKESGMARGALPPSYLENRGKKRIDRVEAPSPFTKQNGKKRKEGGGRESREPRKMEKGRGEVGSG